jgi:hypothetical protein
MHRKILNIFYFVLCVTFVLLTTAFCQDDEIEIFKEIEEKRTLGDHYFTLSNTLRDPFILTHVRMSLGVGGINDIRFPLIQAGDQKFIFVEGSIFAALLSFEYQHAVKDWLAVHLRFSLIGRLGSDFGTLIVQGINYSTAFDIGWMIRVYRRDKFALSTSIGVSNGNYSIINLQNFIDDIIIGAPNPRIITNNNVLFGLWGMKAAYGFTKFFGLTGVVDIGYGETIQRELDNQFFSVIGLNADMNFKDIFETPLSISVGYLHTTYPQNNNDVIFDGNVLFTQFNYIGRTNFILSLDLSVSKELAGRKNETLWLNTAEFSMRYLF